MVIKTFRKARIEELKPYDNNPRLNEEAVHDVAESMKQCGDLDPIEVDENGVILSGHTRYLAMRSLGIEEADIVQYEGLTEEQKRKYRILANKTGEKAAWDFEKLKAEIEGLDFSDFDFDFDFDLPQGEGEIESLAGIREASAPGNVKTVCKAGDVWVLGRHRLICGDSTDEAVIGRLMCGRLSDLCVTDPPYGVDYASKNEALNAACKGNSIQDPIKNDGLAEEDFGVFLERSMNRIYDALKPGGALYVWAPPGALLEDFQRAMREAGITPRQTLTWVKNNIVLGRMDYQWRQEPCLYGWKEGAGHYFVKSRRQQSVLPDEEELDTMDRAQLVKLFRDLREIVYRDIETDVIEEPKPQSSKLHPTTKPVRLISRLIRNSSRVGELVLDVFGGSGTTLIAAEQMGRMCYMCELDEHYCDVIIGRWEELTGRKAERLEG